MFLFDSKVLNLIIQSFFLPRKKGPIDDFVFARKSHGGNFQDYGVAWRERFRKIDCGLKVVLEHLQDLGDLLI